MNQVIQTDPEIDKLAIDAVENARALIAESLPNLKRYDKASRKRFTRLFKDPKAISVTVSLLMKLCESPPQRIQFEF